MQSTVSQPEAEGSAAVGPYQRGLLAGTQQQIADIQRELATIKADQPRLRSNLEKIPGTDPLAKRILEKLNQQEGEIEQYEEQLKKLNAKADEQRRDYEAFPGEAGCGVTLTANALCAGLRAVHGSPDPAPPTTEGLQPPPAQGDLRSARLAGQDDPCQARV